MVLIINNLHSTLIVMYTTYNYIAVIVYHSENCAGWSNIPEISFQTLEVMRTEEQKDTRLAKKTAEIEQQSEARLGLIELGKLKKMLYACLILQLAIN